MSKNVFVPNERIKDGPSIIAILFFFWMPPVCAGLIALKGARHLKKRRYMNYRQIACFVDDRDVISLAELSAKTGRPIEAVKSDLKSMIANGYFVSGTYIDHVRNNLVIGNAASYNAGWSGVPDEIAEALSEIGEAVAVGIREFRKGMSRAKPEESYRTYRPAPKPEVKVEVEPSRNAGPARPKPVAHTTASFNPEYEEMLRKIREANEAIADPAVSKRIARIESLCASIFSVVKARPEQAEEVRKFMNYYLPTTLKLLNTYALMEKQSYQGENITASRKKIEEILNTLVEAFEIQNDNMFKSSALDIDTDVEVLSTMLHKDGLVQDDMSINLRKAQGGH